MGETLTTITTWAAALAGCLERQGLAPRPLFDLAGLNYEQLRDIDARYPVSGMTRLWRAAAEQTGNPAIGLEVAASLQPGALHALGSAVLASETLADAYRRLDRYSRIVSNAGRWSIELGQTEIDARLEVAEQGRVVSDEAVDAFVGAAVRLGELMSQNRFRPRRIKLRRTAPADPAPWERHFRCPVDFAQTSNSMLVPAEYWDAPLLGANPAVAQALEQLVDEYLARMDRERVAYQARRELLRQLPSGEPGLAGLAGALHLSERSLQRRLEAENTSYQSLLEETRRELACGYLAQSRYSLSEVAFLLGFSDQSNFNRAFRRWTGQAPGQYRRERLA